MSGGLSSDIHSHGNLFTFVTIEMMRILAQDAHIFGSYLVCYETDFM